ncbi:hypothetical protein [Streptomyces sp. NPDC001415]
MLTTLPRRRAALAGTALACLLALAACGEDPDPPTKAPLPASDPPEATASAGEPPKATIAAEPGTCDATKPGGAGPWKTVLTEFRAYLDASGPAWIEVHVKDATVRDCPGGDREANVLTDYDPYLSAPNVGAEVRKKADRIAWAFTEWRDQKFHDEGWVYVINGAVETVTKRAW